MQNNTTPNYNKAIKVAGNLLRKYKISNPPVIAKNIAEQCGLQIIFVNFSALGPEYQNISGFIDAETNKMYVNNQELPKRQNFTIAHELGHHMLNHTKNSNYKMLYRDSNNNSHSSLEQEANCFASSLLVPQNMLEKIIADYPHINNYELANIFGVSEMVISFRKKHLGII